MGKGCAVRDLCVPMFVCVRENVWVVGFDNPRLSSRQDNDSLLAQTIKCQGLAQECVCVCVCVCVRVCVCVYVYVCACLRV